MYIKKNDYLFWSAIRNQVTVPIKPNQWSRIIQITRQVWIGTPALKNHCKVREWPGDYCVC